MQSVVWSTQDANKGQGSKVVGSKNKGNWNGKKCFNSMFQTLSSNLEWHEGTILKKCLSVPQRNPTIFLKNVITCILGTFWAMHMEVELVHIEVHSQNKELRVHP